MPARRQAGFTLLEVLVAMTILAVAVTTMIQLTSQVLRLVRLAGEHQEAVLLADRLVREGEAQAQEVERGEQGAYTWERRLSPVPVPEELDPIRQVATGRAFANVRPALSAIAVTVRWGHGRAVELSTLRASLVETGQPSP